MTMSYIDNQQLMQMLQMGCRNLNKNKDRINKLNVFPVPDGDTGMNMWCTIRGGVNETEKGIVGGVGEAMRAFSRGVLFSARGNSGVILSQFINGFSKGAEGKEVLSIRDFIACMRSGTAKAYAAVVQPVEGTMLTVMRESTEFAEKNEANFESFEELIEKSIHAMNDSLARTPELLPVLKEAGVIDSGGAGLIVMFEGMLAALCGEEIGEMEDNAKTAESSHVSLSPAASTGSASQEYGYCTEFILQLDKAKTDRCEFSLDEMKSCFSKIGNSIVAVQDEDIVKIHVHTYLPEDVLAYAHRFGEFVTLKIENMSVQHGELIKKEMPPFALAKNATKNTKYAVVAVVSGEGLKDYFLEIGASAVIDGGQTQNPSTEVFIKTFEALNAEHIVVLPNNSNIIMTAQQAAKYYKSADVRIIPTKSVAECYSALSMMNRSAETVEDFIEAMEEPISNVTTCYISQAVRDSHLSGVDVKEGDYIGICGDEILLRADSPVEALEKAIPLIPDIEDKEVFVVFYGANVSSDDIETLRTYFDDEYPMADAAFICGKQEIYDFIISVE